MSFSASVKNDLARVVSQQKCCNKAEFIAFLRSSGNIQIGRGNAVSLSLTSEHSKTARRMFTLAKEYFGLETEIIMHRKARLRKNQVFELHIPPQPGIKLVLELLGIEDESKLWEHDFSGVIKRDLVKNQCCPRAYLRGAFLGGGSINDPQGEYHLEFSFNDFNHALFVKDLLAGFEINGKLAQRKQTHIVYLKYSEEIVKLLNVMGSHRSLLEFENARIVKDMRNQINRQVNCETANLNKTVGAGLKQVDDIKLIDEYLGLKNLPPNLWEMARVRLEFPDSSLSELAEYLHLGRSGVNHRLRRISKIADDLRLK